MTSIEETLFQPRAQTMLHVADVLCESTENRINTEDEEQASNPSSPDSWLTGTQSEAKDEAESDFGDFETAQDENVPTTLVHENENDEFDAFEHFSNPIPYTDLTSPDYTSNLSQSLQTLLGPPPVVHEEEEWVENARTGWSEMKLENGGGSLALYRRRVPVGFLRSGGTALFLMTKTTCVQHRFLSKIGVDPTMLHFQPMGAVTDSTAMMWSDSQGLESFSEQSKRDSMDEMMMTKDESMSTASALDLDFLVQQISSQALTRNPSNKSLMIEENNVDQNNKGSSLAELFEGILDASSKATSTSSVSSTGPNENFVVEGTAESSQSINQEWDDFVVADEQEQNHREKWDYYEGQDLAPKEEQDDHHHHQKNELYTEHDDESQVVDPEMNKEQENLSKSKTGSSQEPCTTRQEEQEEDIFSGEWLHQLQSAHGRTEDQTQHQVKDDGADWGQFEEAPKEEMKNFPAAVITNEDPFYLLVSKFGLSSKMDQSTSTVSSLSRLQRGQDSVNWDEDEDWGAFQGSS